MKILELGRGFNEGLHWIYGQQEASRLLREPLRFWVVGADAAAVEAVFAEPGYSKKYPAVYCGSSQNYGNVYELNQMPKLCRNLAATPPNYVYARKDDWWAGRDYVSYQCDLCRETDTVLFDSPDGFAVAEQVHTHPRWLSMAKAPERNPDLAPWRAARTHQRTQTVEEVLRELWVPLRDPALRTLRLKGYGLVRLPTVAGEWLHPDEAVSFLESYERERLPETYALVEEGLALARHVRADAWSITRAKGVYFFGTATGCSRWRSRRLKPSRALPRKPPPDHRFPEREPPATMNEDLLRAQRALDRIVTALVAAGIETTNCGCCGGIAVDGVEFSDIAVTRNDDGTYDVKAGYRPQDLLGRKATEYQCWAPAYAPGTELTLVTREEYLARLHEAAASRKAVGQTP